MCLDSSFCCNTNCWWTWTDDASLTLGMGHVSKRNLYHAPLPTSIFFLCHHPLVILSHNFWMTFARFQFPKTRKHCTSLLASSITITASSPDMLRSYNLFTWCWQVTVLYGLPPVSKHFKQPKRLCQRL